MTGEEAPRLSVRCVGCKKRLGDAAFVGVYETVCGRCNRLNTIRLPAPIPDAHVEAPSMLPVAPYPHERRERHVV